MAYTSDAEVGTAEHEAAGWRSLKTRFAGLQERMPPRNYMIAAAAVALGTGLAAIRWRRIRREANLEHGIMLPGVMLAEVVCE
jgi:hypothetical protein